MSLNHHILAKTTTDSILIKFKAAEWEYADGKGKDFYRTGVSADFPSPDAQFYDPANRVAAAFEFKPPTETKRGILTGIGQEVAYLQDCDIAFLIAPKTLGDFPLGEYLSNLYADQIAGKIPCGLILYDNDEPTRVTLAHNVSIKPGTSFRRSAPEMDRFWAKHQDLPVALFHLILHYYYLDQIGEIEGDPFAACFEKELISPTVVQDLECKKQVADLWGNPIKTVGGAKNIVFLEKKLKAARKNPDQRDAIRGILQDIDTHFTGDNYYNSIRKNYLSFLKHLQVIDSEGVLTDKGFALYHLGLTNGPTSKLFLDYFARELLMVGHHLDLILDLDALRQTHGGLSLQEILSEMEQSYEERGFIKRNPARMRGSSTRVKFLKYERILWKSLGLVDQDGFIQWRRITEICSLPDLP